MPELDQGRLRFRFPADWAVSQFDRWEFYRSEFQHRRGGRKAVDMLAIERIACAWVIEVTDCRRSVVEMGQIPQIDDILYEFAQKVRDTLEALPAARDRAQRPAEKRAARMALACAATRVVLHLEQPTRTSKIRRRLGEPAVLAQRLKQLVGDIDPRALVLDMQTTNATNRVAWTVKNVRTA